VEIKREGEKKEENLERSQKMILVGLSFIAVCK
jgi:hypothetical protein